MNSHPFEWGISSPSPLTTYEIMWQYSSFDELSRQFLCRRKFENASLPKFCIFKMPKRGVGWGGLEAEKGTQLLVPAGDAREGKLNPFWARFLRVGVLRHFDNLIWVYPGCQKRL
jgi:hypothetical protein